MPDKAKRPALHVISIAKDVAFDLESIHRRIYEDEDTIVLHSEDIKAIMGHIDELTKRLSVIEERLDQTMSGDVNDDEVPRD